MSNTTCNGDNPWLTGNQSQEKDQLLLLFDMDVSCHRPFLPGTSLESVVIPTARASSFTLQYL